MSQDSTLESPLLILSSSPHAQLQRVVLGLSSAYCPLLPFARLAGSRSSLSRGPTNIDRDHLSETASRHPQKQSKTIPSNGAFGDLHTTYRRCSKQVFAEHLPACSRRTHPWGWQIPRCRQTEVSKSSVCRKPQSVELSRLRCAQVESLSGFRAIPEMRVYQALGRSETYRKTAMNMYFAEAKITQEPTSLT
jgi:hypothetical protein